mmetsp:Transcript_35111/g.34144  ORF Transcript_35111/g.34144 Transcript_35111/m.34144 type:complete len:101 (+) Transcript_35111:754-1056(+)
MTWLYNIWDCVKNEMYSLLYKYINQRYYSINEKRPGDSMTPLHLAVILGKYEVVKMLMRLGADPSIVENRGLTPLQLIANKHDSHYRKIKIFIEDFGKAK